MKKVIDKAESRGRALYDWLDSHHTFSFDTYYNPVSYTHLTLPTKLEV